MSQLPLRSNVCMLVYNSDRKLFFGERCGCEGVWQFPQGGVEEDLSLEENVIKELHEELGANPKLFSITKQLRATHSYEWENPPEQFVGKYRGQTQTFWMVEFLGEDSDIQLDRFEPEFMNWQWCTTHVARGLAEPVRLPGYMMPFREFDDHWILKDEGLLR